MNGVSFLRKKARQPGLVMQLLLIPQVHHFVSTAAILMADWRVICGGYQWTTTTTSRTTSSLTTSSTSKTTSTSLTRSTSITSSSTSSKAVQAPLWALSHLPTAPRWPKPLLPLQPACPPARAPVPSVSLAQLAFPWVQRPRPRWQALQAYHPRIPPAHANQNQHRDKHHLLHIHKYYTFLQHHADQNQHGDKLYKYLVHVNKFYPH